MSKSIGERLRWIAYAAGVVFAVVFVFSYATGR